MKKYLFLIFCLLSGTSVVWSQSFDFGNDWYRASPNQTYIKLVVEVDGVYRVTSQDLLDAGYDLANVDARMLRLYYRGKEIPMYVSQTGNTLEYLEFLGQTQQWADRLAHVS